MLGLSDVRHFRRLAAGFCLIAAPLALLVGALVHPEGKDAAAAHLDVVRKDPDRYYAAHVFLLAGLALFLPAVLGLMHLLRQRATAVAHAGGGLAMIGLFGATAIVAVDGIAISQMGQPEASVAEMAALLDRIKDSAGFLAIGVVGAVSLLVGMLMLAYGLWRVGAAEPWVAAGIAAAAVAMIIGQVTETRAVLLTAFSLYLLALGRLGWKILTESDEEWAPAGAAPAPTGTP